MTDLNHSSDKGILNFWNKIPIIIRAILLGFLVSTLGITIWAGVATFLMMPWSFILMAGLLWLFVKYTSGNWWPERTKAFREVNFRRKSLAPQAWLPALLGALFIVLIEQSGLVFTFRLMEFPAEDFLVEYSFLSQVPTWAAWLFIIMISAVAGICEEVGFRGYMQVPLEKKYGPVVGIAIVSVVFVVVHLHQAWSGPILIHIFLMSAIFGAIAWFSGSLIPGIIAHIIMDICNFSFWWSDLGGQFDRETIFTTGVDSHFILWTGIFVISITGFVMAMRKLNAYR